MSILNVLVVDDEPGIRTGVTRVLRNFTVGFPFMDDDFSFRTLETGSGEEAIEILEREPVDIVLLDNKLPGIYGIEVLEYIRQQEYDIQVMMITSHASLDLAVKATNNGAYNFVPKPFTPQELKAAMESITKHLYLRRMTRKLNEQGKQVRFQFLSVLSHELKSPINAIEGYLKIMQEKQAGEAIEDYQGMISRSLERIKGMRGLIMDLLDLTRIESGKKKRNIIPVDITELARMAMHSMEPMAIQKSVKIHFTGDQPIYIHSDPSEMEIILNNLLSNAVKYNREGGEVFVSVEEKPQGITVDVKDTGIGMDDAEVGELFKEFVRIRNSKTKDITGSGLGLSIVKKLTDLNHGAIRVSSRPDQGSHFSVIFPRE
ncbi:MAG: hybrid sensor histidine kinase/response regulator [Bacteroidales bacterium]|nr:hybrid sensor histidine kinase/response regulator [Bacteroidales bacterium]